jgi:hypothetical protein
MKRRILTLTLTLIMLTAFIPAAAAASSASLTYIEIMPPMYDAVMALFDGVYRIQLNGLWGTADRDGNIIIPPTYGATAGFIRGEGWAGVRLNYRWGAIGKDGREIIPPIYDSMEVLRGFDCEHLIRVRLNGKWGLYDNTGKVIVPPKYDEIRAFNDGVASVRVGEADAGKYGLIDTTGREIVPPIYDNDIWFSDGLAHVRRDGKSGYIDITGRVVIPITYGGASLFSEGLAWVHNNGQYSIIDQTGKVVADKITYPNGGQVSFGHAWGFNGGYAFIFSADFINRNFTILSAYFVDKAGVVAGKLPGEFRFGMIMSLGEGIWRVQKGDQPNHKAGAINSKGDIIVPADYMTVWEVRNDLIMVHTHEDKRGFYDLAGKVVVPAVYDQASLYDDGYIHVINWQDTPVWEHGIFDRTGKAIVPVGKYSSISWFSEGLAEVMLDDKWGYIDTTGKEVLPLKYEWAARFVGGMAAVGLDGKTIIIDKTGRELITLPYDSAIMLEENVAAVMRGDKWGIVHLVDTTPNLDTAGSWAHTYINTAFSHGIIPPSLQNHYTRNTTRAEFCALAVALIETLTGKEITERMIFADDGGDINIRKIGGLGIVTGTGSNAAGERLFSPNLSIERQAAALILARVADYGLGKPLPDGEHAFTDIDRSFATDAIVKMRGGSIINGKSASSFAPFDPYTREESITTMVRMWNWFNR